jgi:hypothetical protein
MNLLPGVFAVAFVAGFVGALLWAISQGMPPH